MFMPCESCQLCTKDPKLELALPKKSITVPETGSELQGQAGGMEIEVETQDLNATWSS